MKRLKTMKSPKAASLLVFNPLPSAAPRSLNEAVRRIAPLEEIVQSQFCWAIIDDKPDVIVDLLNGTHHGGYKIDPNTALKKMYDRKSGEEIEISLLDFARKMDRRNICRILKEYGAVEAKPIQSSSLVSKLG